MVQQVVNNLKFKNKICHNYKLLANIVELVEVNLILIKIYNN